MPQPQYSRPVQTLIDQLAGLPGIGARSAERIAFHLLKLPAPQALLLADAVRDAKTRVVSCGVCYNLAESPPGDADASDARCEVCRDPARDAGVVLVVEQPKDVLALEAASNYEGVYHVLLGRIAPLEGSGPEELTISALLARLSAGTVRELILGTNPNVDGDATSLYVQQLVEERFPSVAVTRLARGLSAGTQLEYANKSVLADAIAGRRKA